jgi:hypothetical protein
MRLVIRAAACAVLLLASLHGTARAVSFTFATYTFDQDHTPDVYTSLVAGNYNGAIINTQAITATSGIAFPDNPVPGSFNKTRTLGVQSGLGTSSSSRGVNLPNGNMGANNRSGFELSWSSGLRIANGAGKDLVYFESASSVTGDEGFAIQVYNATASAWTSWYYQDFDAFESYTGLAEGGAAYGIDLTHMGVPAGNEISKVRLVNLTNRDSFGAASGPGFFVKMEDTSGTAHGFDAVDLDPDPVYITSLAALVPVEVSKFTID